MPPFQIDDSEKASMCKSFTANHDTTDLMPSLVQLEYTKVKPGIFTKNEFTPKTK